MNFRDVTVFDGHGYIPGSGTYNYELPVSGFQTALSGPINMKLCLMAGEGDRPITGDRFWIQKLQTTNWERLYHGGNDSTNFFNSSIFTGGNTRNPNLLNNTGMDVAMFNINNPSNTVIGNNQTSTKFYYRSTQDTYIIYCIAMAVDAYRPEPEGLNTIATINGVPYTTGMQVLPGQNIVYELEIRNNGNEAINNTHVVIPVPYAATYVSCTASFEYTPVGNLPCDYDAGAGANGSIIWHIGTLPTTTPTGELLATLTYTLQATTDCIILSNPNCEAAVTVDGDIDGVGAISGVTVTDDPFIQGYETSGQLYW